MHDFCYNNHRNRPFVLKLNVQPTSELAMNKQQKNGHSRGIEWTDWTWNPTAGCMHGCTWQMPDGSIAECYAKKIAEGLARAAYPEGFEHHYWRGHVLHNPLYEKKPAKIFVGSMADLFGHWVPKEQIEQVLEVMREAHWHTFQTLSKYPIRLPEFNPIRRMYGSVSACLPDISCQPRAQFGR
jgi:protein gp37